MTRLLVTGSRDWDEPDVIERALVKAWFSFLPTGRTVLVSGACPTGADHFAEMVAASRNWQIERHPANWDLYGSRARFIRNKKMVDLGADIVLAFIRNDSKGATMTLKLAVEAGLPTVVWRVNA